MMPQAEALYNLQKIDLEIISRRKRLDEIAVALEDNAAINDAKAHVEAAEKSVSPLRANLRDTELEMQSNTTKFKGAEERLYSGNVKNPKEMQDLQQEIASLKNRNDTLETTSLELMMELEEAEATLSQRQATLEQTIAESEDEHADLIQERAQLEAEIDKLKEDRKGALKNVTAENYETYKSMRKRKANQPIAPLNGNSCGICGIQQTVAIVQDVHKRQMLIECLNCGRILADV